MLRRIPIRWTIALSFICGSSLTAQISAGVGALLQRDDGGIWQSTTRLEPAFRFDVPLLRLNATSSIAGSTHGQALRWQQGDASMIVATPSWRGFRLSNQASIERIALNPVLTRVNGTVESALSFVSSKNGAWLGIASEGTTNFDGSNARPLLRVGVWRQLGLMTLSIGTEAHSARVVHRSAIRDSLSPDTSFAVHWSDVRARVGWSTGRVALDGLLGLRPEIKDARSTMWGRATATIAMASRFSLVASLGSEAARPWVGLPATHFATLGLKIASASFARPEGSPHIRPAVAAFSLRPAEHGMYVVMVRVPLARTVELSGDFDQWHPVALREVMPDVWEATLPLTPGTYHVNLRVNGDAWMSPPGLPSTADEFNGTVGLLVVR